MKKFVIAGGLVGLVIPFIFWGVYWAFDHIFGAEAVLFWPSSIFLMATAGHENTWGAFQIAAISVTVNVALYSLIGLLLYFAKRIFNRFYGDT